ncbi:MAG: N-acetylglucosamine-6-phosphate deacetylase [Actinomycetota bacterium]|nr:N-acetylglucosamine-6-phosphate deacetylase [Actinomycetota bacterium]MDK1016532.1 N-acetylglucosamine-6-phosphate deacetylase [Actinomycetota bacterium]MDK1025881.1 N-acetylglucosamine-6-phosphate deacetylase [Actinomycetota bacterium]MDK1038638.1 N-acetylglucosamine-6-phosphate deacetylase [Actinomycetota bacterium]MDK1096675.1 N-acetylglucosamine-6-phosphate deacetylase [Actinomycetota bacterium]
MRLGVKAALVDGQLVRGDVAIDGEYVDAIGLSPAGGTGLAVPGLIDLQINGFDGVDFTSAGTDDYRHVAKRLAATGVTSFQPTLISLPADQYVAALGRLDPSEIRDARILGMHLEGPFLSPAQCGAHDPENMIHPDLTLTQQFLDAGHFTHMTIAPELPGALELIDFLSTRGVTVALGHTDCDAETATTAFDSGARSVTHIFGAQRPWGHRDPGVSGVALVRSDVFVTAIVDGIHLAPETVQLAANAAGERFVLITDAIAAAGRPDGRYPLGDRSVILEHGACRLDDGTLAGSALTLDQAIRNMIDLGFDPLRAIGAATTAPAALIRRTDLGSLAPGGAADVCVMDDSFEVVRTIVFGSESFAA